MAKVKGKPQPVVEEVEIEEEETVDLDDLEIEDVEEVEEEGSEEEEAIEEELEEAAPVPQKAKRTPPTNSPMASVQPIGADEVGAAFIAEKCGVEPRVIRAFLRKNYRNMDESKSERYHWKKNDPALVKIIRHFLSEKNGAAAQPAPAPAAKPVQAAKPATQPAKPQATVQKPVAKPAQQVVKRK